MARFRDRYGYELSTSSAAAAGAYVQAVDHALAGTGGLEVALEAALTADPGFALAQVAAARNYQFLGRAAEAREASERALALAPGTSRREQQHVACVARSIGGDGPGCLALLREHVGEFPRDAYVLSMATGPFGLIGFGGDRTGGSRGSNSWSPSRTCTARTGGSTPRWRSRTTSSTTSARPAGWQSGP